MLPHIIVAIEGEPVSSELPELLCAVYTTIHSQNFSLPQIKASLCKLLEFLATPKERTNANCNATDSFFGSDENWPEGSWDRLPQSFQDVLCYMSEALHDTVSAPDVASNFGCTPEQILEMLRKVKE